MRGLAFLDKFKSGDTPKIKLCIGNTLFQSLIVEVLSTRVTHPPPLTHSSIIDAATQLMHVKYIQYRCPRAGLVSWEVELGLEVFVAKSVGCFVNPAGGLNCDQTC